MPLNNSDFLMIEVLFSDSIQVLSWVMKRIWTLSKFGKSAEACMHKGIL